MERYIGLDAHAKSCTFAVISESGKRLKSAVVETNGRALIEFIKTVPGRTHVCLEEGTQSGWLYEILSPHVDEIIVTHLEQENRGRKDDLTDAFARAEQLRAGAVTPVFKDGGDWANCGPWWMCRSRSRRTWCAFRIASRRCTARGACRRRAARCTRKRIATRT